MRRYNDIKSVDIQLIWNPMAFRGYVFAVLLATIVIFFMQCVRTDPPKPIEVPRMTPYTFLVFGEGDGTGARKGNLTAEGAAQRGTTSPNPLEDAATAAASRDGKTPVSDPSTSSNLRPVDNLGTRGKENDGSAERMIGSEQGSDEGTGLGLAGSGKGKGLGYGDIDWGGGGNRIVLTKVLPKKPPGTLDTQVKLRFRVAPDGSVTLVLPVQKGGNPIVDAAAMNALRQWRFNRLPDDRIMEGTITFTFKSS
ncbi:MAG TPA: hypothetical protein DIS79_07550 [Bacteroidetes bacterium]|nr:hypothetical protein [Bacteroidota bacterium]HRK03964.1 TonB family protein [Chlorobiota bacterium]